MTKRRLAREYCLQALYLTDAGHLDYQKATIILKELKSELDEKTAVFADSLLSGALENSENIDSVISKYATNWTIERMSQVDRCILRLGSFELIYVPDIPIAAVIDEAIELAKKYSTDKSSKFINGVLDKIKDERKPRK
ncbi:MAG TPA: transcription antitermination factor NusB [Elusimicrobiales bacterium]|nr:transcription antitermination factor NusB [Elusimicrobiales bacterium]